MLFDRTPALKQLYLYFELYYFEKLTRDHRKYTASARINWRAYLPHWQSRLLATSRI